MGEPHPPSPTSPPAPAPADNELIIDVDAINDGASPDELVLPSASSAVWYCPSWACPACLGPIKVSTFVRALVVGIMLSVVVALFVLSLIPGSPVTGFIVNLLQEINAVPFYWKLLAMWLFYLLSAPFGLPVTPLNLACGFLFGFVYGVLIAIVGTMLGSTICFIWGRTLLYSWAREQTEKRRLLQALTIAIRNQAIRLIALTHLSPILPATLLHYTYSAMGVPFLRFSWGTFLGILPFVVVYVYLGSVSQSLTSALADENTSWGKQLLWMVLIVLFSMVILAVVTWIARRELNRAMAELEGEDEEAHLDHRDEGDEEMVVIATVDRSPPSPATGVTPKRLEEDEDEDEDPLEKEKEKVKAQKVLEEGEGGSDDYDLFPEDVISQSSKGKRLEEEQGESGLGLEGVQEPISHSLGDDTSEGNLPMMPQVSLPDDEQELLQHASSTDDVHALPASPIDEEEEEQPAPAADEEDELQIVHVPISLPSPDIEEEEEEDRLPHHPMEEEDSIFSLPSLPFLEEEEEAYAQAEDEYDRMESRAPVLLSSTGGDEDDALPSQEVREDDEPPFQEEEEQNEQLSSFPLEEPRNNNEPHEENGQLQIITA